MSKMMIDMEMPERCLDCDFYINGNSGFMLYGIKIGGKCKMLPIKDMDGEVIDYQNICKNSTQTQELLKGRDKRCPLQEVRKEMAKLKPCPFCGGIATLYTEEIPNGYSGDINYIIECTNCEANVRGYDTEQQAIEAWNRRRK